MGAEPAEVKTQSSTVVELLDECWFFKSVWITRDGGCGSQDRAVSSTCKNRTPALHRMPTLPPRLRCMDAVQEEAASSLNACNPKLRHSLSSLDNYRSSSSSSSKVLPQPTHSYHLSTHFQTCYIFDCNLFR